MVKRGNRPSSVDPEMFKVLEKVREQLTAEPMLFRPWITAKFDTVTLTGAVYVDEVGSLYCFAAHLVWTIHNLPTNKVIGNLTALSAASPRLTLSRSVPDPVAVKTIRTNPSGVYSAQWLDHEAHLQATGPVRRNGTRTELETASRRIPILDRHGQPDPSLTHLGRIK